MESTAVQGAQETADIAAGQAACEVEVQFERPIAIASALRATGRFVPYWRRAGSDIAVVPRASRGRSAA